ncbi:MAG: hypothetical protein Q9170_003005 [Blastenia crenularia]
MGAKEHASACERGLGRIKQQRVKLCRAKTFAFGQQHQLPEDSPTACSRQSNVLDLGMDISMDHNLEARRMLKLAASVFELGSANAARGAQIEVVEEQVGNIDPKTNFRLIIIQTELERFKFLVRSFLRTRIAKIDKYTLYSLTNPVQLERLSPSELRYAQSHQALLEGHYRSSFLSQFPTNLQRLDDTAGGISMIEQPDVDKAVFVRALRNVEEPVIVEGTDIDFKMKRGDVYVVRWSAVRDLILNGNAELI